LDPESLATGALIEANDDFMISHTQIDGRGIPSSLSDLEIPL
jgi:hypothetical protein